YRERGLLPVAGMVDEDSLPTVLKEAKTFKPALERLLVYAWRRQMAATISRRAATAALTELGEDTLMTVGFADLVGFTRLSRQIPESELARLVEQFEAVSSDIVAGTGARLVKTLGDEVLFVHTSVSVVAETALRL